MKIFLCTLFSLCFSSIYAQNTEGYIQYTIEVEAVDTSLKTKQSVGMLRNSKMEIYFTQEQLRIDFQMGQLSTTQMVVDYKKDSSLSMQTNRYGNYAVLNSTDELTYPTKDSTSSIRMIDETKNILGFNCKKAIVSSKGIETTYWYTNEIVIDFKDNQFFDNSLPGFPLYFSKVENGVFMQYQASNFVSRIEDIESVFSLKIPADYNVMPK